MRMRADVHALAGHELHRPEMIEEDEGPDHLALAVRQRAAHLESVAEVAGARHDDELQRVAGVRIAEHGIVGGKPAHEEISVILPAIITAIIPCRPSAELSQSLRRPGECAFLFPLPLWARKGRGKKAALRSAGNADQHAREFFRRHHHGVVAGGDFGCSAPVPANPAIAIVFRTSRRSMMVAPFVILDLWTRLASRRSGE